MPDGVSNRPKALRLGPEAVDTWPEAMSDGPETVPNEPKAVNVGLEGAMISHTGKSDAETWRGPETVKFRP